MRGTLCKGFLPGVGKLTYLTHHNFQAESDLLSEIGLHILVTKVIATCVRAFAFL